MTTYGIDLAYPGEHVTAFEFTTRDEADRYLAVALAEMGDHIDARWKDAHVVEHEGTECGDHDWGAILASTGPIDASGGLASLTCPRCGLGALLQYSVIPDPEHEDGATS